MNNMKEVIKNWIPYFLIILVFLFFYNVLCYSEMTDNKACEDDNLICNTIIEEEFKDDNGQSNLNENYAYSISIVNKYGKEKNFYCNYFIDDKQKFVIKDYVEIPENKFSSKICLKKNIKSIYVKKMDKGE